MGDVTDVENIFEIYSERTGFGSIRFTRFVPPPLMEEQEGAPFYQERPILLIVEEDHSQPQVSSVMRFFSTKTGKITEMRLKKQIIDVQCSSRAISVLTPSCIYLINPVTLSRMNVFGDKNRIVCYPNSAMALGSRWLAFATMEESLDSIDEPISTIEVAKDVGFRVASTLMSTYDLAVSTYMGKNEVEFSPPPSVKERKKALDDAAGTIAIYDLVSDRIVYRVKAHKEPVSYLCFNPSGTILSTASVSGNSVNIIRMKSSITLESGRKESCVSGSSLYSLYRGHTNAIITQVRFTSDSHWVAVRTSKGTTHLFPINPEGGEVNTRTHPPLGEVISAEAALKSQPLLASSNVEEARVQYALNRLRLTNEGNESADYGSFQFAFLPGNSRKILQFNPSGTLTQFQLEPVRTYDGNNIPVLSLSVAPQQEWNLNRKLSSSRMRADFSSEEKLTRTIPSPVNRSENFWASFSEICTYDLKLLERKKVLISQRVLFHFQSYDEEQGEDLAQSVMIYPKPSSRLRSAMPASPARGAPKPERKGDITSNLQAAMSTKMDGKKRNSPDEPRAIPLQKRESPPEIRYQAVSSRSQAMPQSEEFAMGRASQKSSMEDSSSPVALPKQESKEESSEHDDIFGP